MAGRTRTRCPRSPAA